MSSSTLVPTPTEPPDTAGFTTTVVFTVLASTTQIATVYDRDPYLDYQPAFAYSLPMQFLLTGVILALSTILLIHLVFTAPYHWPLAKLNYGLQLSGAISLLLSLGITLSVILEDVLETSREWPYMLDYLAVNIPLRSWSPLDHGWWYTLDAVTSGLAHMTHIQFLTILYPSVMEERLIFGLLGPLVILSSLSSFLSLQQSLKDRFIADSIRNICNSTLAVLFSVALWIWGLIINRDEAWRTDGGTAIFGGGALALSLVAIGLNLYQIAEIPPVWIPPLNWAIVLWQSFLGWWWYVGSAAPEPMPRIRRKNKKRNKSQNGERTRLSKVRDRLGLGDGPRRRRTAGDGDSSTDPTRCRDERDTETPQSPQSQTAPNPPAPPNTNGRFQSLTKYLTSPLIAWWNRLRQAHVNAKEQQAAENEQKRFDVYGYIDENGQQGFVGVPGSGWGLGSFALSSRRRAAERPPGNERDEESGVEMGDMSARPSWGDDEPRRAPQRQRLRPAGREELSTPSSSWSWMGPFRSWRLRDATVY